LAQQTWPFLNHHGIGWHRSSPNSGGLIISPPTPCMQNELSFCMQENNGGGGNHHGIGWHRSSPNSGGVNYFPPTPCMQNKLSFCMQENNGGGGTKRKEEITWHEGLMVAWLWSWWSGWRLQLVAKEEERKVCRWERENLVTHSPYEVVKQLFVVEMMVVKLVVGEGHGGERNKRETVVEKEKTREKADFLINFGL